MLDDWKSGFITYRVASPTRTIRVAVAVRSLS
jgi:hypothetical protein